MTGVVIVDAARTPIGRFRGALSSIRADHLGALVLNALLQRNGLTAQTIDDVVFGCVSQVGEQSANIARTAVLSAGWPETIPGLTIDRKCGSAEAAVHVAAGLIAAGACDAVIAGGAESMSRVPMGGNRDVHGEAFGWKLQQRFETVLQGEAAERVSDKWGFDRRQLDDYAIESHRRAGAAADQGRFDREIVTVSVPEWAERDSVGQDQVSADETIRRDTSLERLATLKTSFRPDGRITAGNASQISDGAAALILMSETRAKALGLRPRARIVAMSTVGSDPTLMLTGPIPATQKVLARAGLTLNDIELFEVNEAFAPVPMAWMQETGVSHDRLNVNGGAIALGHPLGASGARIMTTLLHELERREARYGLQAICCAGGMATSTIIERLEP
ncbi:MAG TPA: thiolase family protein [Caulobacteraceae bacterium]|jgi:acetyl-CoA acyltransferase